MLVTVELPLLFFLSTGGWLLKSSVVLELKLGSLRFGWDFCNVLLLSQDGFDVCCSTGGT